ncbi:hypothetical protein F4808DRAFT_428434 [Astrocystis sublimbata]|nr:hypothetical protein F4808DRAFT_428434 [Astrocystis sublimbata]
MGPGMYNGVWVILLIIICAPVSGLRINRNDVNDNSSMFPSSKIPIYLCLRQGTTWLCTAAQPTCTCSLRTIRNFDLYLKGYLVLLSLIRQHQPPEPASAVHRRQWTDTCAGGTC